MLRLLCITAHPDDEAGAFAGALLHAHDRGAETGVVCLTPGQAARNRGGAASDAELAAMRRAEFARSTQLLRVNRAEVLDYPDQGLKDLNLWQVVEVLVLRIREFRPHVLLTFGGDGAITGHRDHTMAGLFATTAFHWAGSEAWFPGQLTNGLKPHRTQKLYYASWLVALPDRPAVSPAPVTTMLAIDRYLETKIEAFKTHTTQNPLYPRFASTMRELGPVECFHLAAASTPREAVLEDDIFAGVVGD